MDYEFWHFTGVSDQIIMCLVNLYLFRIKS